MLGAEEKSLALGRLDAQIGLAAALSAQLLLLLAARLLECVDFARRKGRVWKRLSDC